MTRAKKARIIAVLILVAGIVAAEAYYFQDIRLAVKPELTLVEARKTPVPGGFRFDAPQGEGRRLIRLGPPPTPLSVTFSVENPSYALAFLYEGLGEMTVVSLDKATGVILEETVPGAQLSYTALVDRKDPSVILIGTSQGAKLMAFGGKPGVLTEIASFPEATHVFGMDQDPDGTLALGTYPDHGCYLVKPGVKGAAVEKAPVPEELIAGRPYLRHVFAAGKYLILHYASPGLLVRFDRETQKGEILLSSKDQFLNCLEEGGLFYAWDRENHLCFDRAGNQVPWPGALPEAKPALVESKGHEAAFVLDGKRFAFSLLPRKGGMPITAFGPETGEVFYGSTYWNTWMFELDAASRTVTGLGPIPDAGAEFFTLCPVGDKILIPHYQGLLFLFDPKAPFGVHGEEKNPRLIGRAEEAHFGLACVRDPEGRVFYATNPNYHQAGGMLVEADASGVKKVFPRIGDNLTLGALADDGDHLLGGTVIRRGLGMPPLEGPPAPCRVVWVDKATGKIDGEVALSKKRRDVRGLVPAGEGAFLAALSGGEVYWITQKDGRLKARRLFRLADDCQEALPVDRERILLLCQESLWLFHVESRSVRPLCRLPVSVAHGGLTPEMGLYLASQGELFWLPPGFLP